MENDLREYLENPSRLSGVSSQELESWASLYPFYAEVQMLLAKKYQQENDPRFKEQLSRAALAVQERHSLCHFINYKTEVVSQHAKPDFNREANEEVNRKRDEVPPSEESLQEVLRSIHERKQAILDSGKQVSSPQRTELKSEKHEEKKSELEEAAASAAEYSFLELDEENTDDFITLPSEGDAMNRIEEEALEQIEFEEHEDMLVVNELAGGGAEYIPTDFTRMESSEEEFIIEQDAEIQSLGVIEEEFIARESDFEKQESEVEFISESESGLNRMASESSGTEADVSALELESEVMIESEFGDRYSPQLKKNKEDDTFRISEEVSSPGEYLPEKSYSFSGWLKFFRLSQPPPAIQKDRDKATVGKEEKPIEESERISLHMQHELESIDKVVAAIHPDTIVPDSSVSAEEMAKKSAQMDEEIVSETLAKIFEAQGHYDKAIRMYVKLSLKVPDKVSFFAARIKELKSKK